jgi:hypothetical protein
MGRERLSPSQPEPGFCLLAEARGQYGSHANKRFSVFGLASSFGHVDNSRST